MNYTPAPITPAERGNREGYLSLNAGLAIQQGIQKLAYAAAAEERISDGSHSEVMLFYVVRSLCAETGVDFDAIVEKARGWARGVELHIATPGTDVE